MIRFLTLALLASAALPVAAPAQDNNRSERREARAAQRAERQAARAAAPAAAAQPQARPDRGAMRGNRGGDGQGWRNNAAVAPAAVAQPQARPDRGNWRGNRVADGQRWRNNAAAVAQPQPQQQVRPRNRGMAESLGLGRDRTQNRDWDRNNDGRRDFNRNDQRRDYNRTEQRRDWNNNDRRWSGNRASNWNRSWRNDRRFDWQGYRNSNRYAYRLPRYYAPSGWGYGYRSFGIGTTLFAGLFAQNYWINDPYNYRLPPAEWPFQWVRYYDDALLVDTETGQVVDSIPGIFW